MSRQEFGTDFEPVRFQRWEARKLSQENRALFSDLARLLDPYISMINPNEDGEIFASDLPEADNVSLTRTSNGLEETITVYFSGPLTSVNQAELSSLEYGEQLRLQHRYLAGEWSLTLTTLAGQLKQVAVRRGPALKRRKNKNSKGSTPSTDGFPKDIREQIEFLFINLELYVSLLVEGNRRKYNQEAELSTEVLLKLFQYYAGSAAELLRRGADPESNHVQVQTWALQDELAPEEIPHLYFARSQVLREPSGTTEYESLQARVSHEEHALHLVEWLQELIDEADVLDQDSLEVVLFAITWRDRLNDGVQPSAFLRALQIAYQEAKNDHSLFQQDSPFKLWTRQMLQNLRKRSPLLANGSDISRPVVLGSSYRSTVFHWPSDSNIPLVSIESVYHGYDEQERLNRHRTRVVGIEPEKLLERGSLTSLVLDAIELQRMASRSNLPPLR
jgi:hypothetical protein